MANPQATGPISFTRPVAGSITPTTVRGARQRVTSSRLLSGDHAVGYHALIASDRMCLPSGPTNHSNARSPAWVSVYASRPSPANAAAPIS